MTPREEKMLEQLQELRRNRESLVGQIRGLTAKVERLEGDLTCSRLNISALEDEVRRQHVRAEALEGEVREARNEASVVRRAYLHERNRADRAGAPSAHAYAGPADRYVTGSHTGGRTLAPLEIAAALDELAQDAVTFSQAQAGAMGVVAGWLRLAHQHEELAKKGRAA